MVRGHVAVMETVYARTLSLEGSVGFVLALPSASLQPASLI